MTERTAADSDLILEALQAVARPVADVWAIN
jgi:hypothetical protein